MIFEILTKESTMKYRIIAGLALLLAPLTGHSQDIRAPFEPNIAVMGRGEVKVSPDRATIQISVQTRAATAAAAAAENANKQQAVLAALKALGLGNDQLSTINYNVYPEEGAGDRWLQRDEYDPGRSEKADPGRAGD
jgi:uncharacterized protein YggE